MSAVRIEPSPTHISHCYALRHCETKVIIEAYGQGAVKRISLDDKPDDGCQVPG